MRFILLATAMVFIPTMAKAELTQGDIDRFTQNYAAIYETCNLPEIRNFVASNFSDDYMATFVSKSNPANTMQAGKAEILGQMQQTLDMMEAKNLTATNCNTNVSAESVSINDGSANVKMLQVEQMTLQTPQGQSIPMAMSSQCVHRMTETNGKVMIMQSNCLAD